MRLLEPIVHISMKIDPHYRQQKCRPMTLVSGNIIDDDDDDDEVACGYSRGLLLAGASNESGVVDDGNF